MEAEELDIAIDELEVRLERLRALYEQYFLGIEKLEPQVVRKDLDRRIFMLRREKIRNTGKRFKLQTIIQRYNTFQQYWGRICREIENGTYKRHILRAEKLVGPTNLLTAAARRRFGKDRLKPDEPAPAEAREPQIPEPVADEITHPYARPVHVAAVADATSDSAAPRARSRVPTIPGLSSAPPPPLPGKPTAPSPLPAFAARTAAGAAPPAPTRTAMTPPAPGATPAPGPRASRTPKPFESLELDMDFMGDWDPGTTGRGRAPLANNARPPARMKSERPPEPARRLAPPPKPPRASSAENAEPVRAEPARAAVVPRGAPAPEKPAVSPTASATATRASAASAAASPAAASAATSAPDAGEKAARPAKPTQPQKPARPAKPAADAAAGDAKLKELHQRFVEASKGAGQPTVSFEGLSKSLRAAEAKLREKHGNRRIDFEVVLKDGKPVVKPVVR